MRRILRGINYFLNYFFVEAPRGLDFSMRDLSGIENESYNGYAMTSKKALKNLLSFIENKQELSFLDIGSGKGAVVYFADSLGFKNSHGIEYNLRLHNIAKKNFKKLKKDSLKSFNVNAEKFDLYNNYDVYFLFNPFDELIYKKVLNQILSQKTNEKLIIFYGKFTLMNFIEESGAKLINSFICPYRKNTVKIYSF